LKKIVVVGGGTAGWLTALAAQKRYPDCLITVIESTEIGILGAGEGSTPNLIPFLDSLGISVQDLIKKTNSTMKLAIKFDNFNNNGNSYYHGFSINKFNLKTKEIFFNTPTNKNKIPVLDLFYMSQDVKQDEYKISAMALDVNKIPFIGKNNQSTDISDFDIYNLYSLHFDARAMAKYLSEVAIQRGVVHVDGVVKDFIQDSTGDIIEIKLKDGFKVNSDFIFDCSGFARLINKNIFKTEWKSFSESLPAKKAVPFFLDIDKENIPAYTESTAMNYGWMWKIPLQHRYGCGYVFDSDYITEDEAKKEIEEKLGHEIQSPKTFTFNPGHYKTIWNKNTIAVGLSSGFVEPLEATSIMQSITVLSIAFRKEFNIFEKNKEHVQILNDTYSADCEEIRDFLYLHYMTDKRNTDFWTNFTINNKMPETLKEKIEDLNSFKYTVGENMSFDPISYYIIMYGNNIFNKDYLQDIYKQYKHQEEQLNKVKAKRKVLSNHFIDHSQFIKQLGGFNE
jgi:tryptophan halogenase